MKRSFYYGLVIGVMLLGLNGVANATVIDFEDINTANNVYVPSGYSGFNWNGGYGSDSWVVTALGDFLDISIDYGVNSPPSGSNYVWSNGGTDLELYLINGTFDFNSMWVAAGHNTTVTVSGFDNGTEIYTQSFDITNQYQLLTFNFTDVDKITISDGYSANLFIDDITVNANAPVPEPSTFILFGAGLAGVAILRRMKKV